MQAGQIVPERDQNMAILAAAPEIFAPNLRSGLDSFVAREACPFWARRRPA